MHHITRIDQSTATEIVEYAAHSQGLTRQKLIGRENGCTHSLLSALWIAPQGFIESVVHSFELSIYILNGSVSVFMQGERITLNKNECLVVPVGVSYAMKASDSGVHWLQFNAPGEVEKPRRMDTFFTHENAMNVKTIDSREFDLRDPRNQHAYRFDPSTMNLDNLAVGAKKDAPAVSASMATALLAYSGIGVRMLIDQRVGAKLHAMFMVDYQPTAIAHPHDHPFEETYTFTHGEVHGLIEGIEYVFHPGDVLWCAVGADHGFENRGTGLVRWIETQAPQPPVQHSYRFSRDWEYLEQKLQGEARS
ncbi:MAG: cupin domain-containing protein [Candidatus Nanopelagicaceae bacterium]